MISASLFTSLLSAFCVRGTEDANRPSHPLIRFPDLSLRPSSGASVCVYTTSRLIEGAAAVQRTRQTKKHPSSCCSKPLRRRIFRWHPTTQRHSVLHHPSSPPTSRAGEACRGTSQWCPRPRCKRMLLSCGCLFGQSLSILDTGLVRPSGLIALPPPPTASLRGSPSEGLLDRFGLEKLLSNLFTADRNFLDFNCFSFFVVSEWGQSKTSSISGKGKRLLLVCQVRCHFDFFPVFGKEGNLQQKE